MAKRVVILGYQAGAQNTVVDAVFWYPITSGARAQANGSAWAGASTAENTAIQNGSVFEERATVSFPTGLDTTSMKANLLARWTQRNTEINGFGPSLFNGVNYDSVSGWSA